MMRWQEALRRVEGLHWSGIDFDLPEHEVTIARRVLRELENRRVLYNPYEQESPELCVKSVDEIRKKLGAELSEIDRDESILVQTLSAMQAACREFLDKVGDLVTRNRELLLPSSWGPSRWSFDSALGGFRRLMGVQVATLSAIYKLQLSDELGSILPPDPNRE